MKSKNRGLCAVIALSLTALLCVCVTCVLAAALPPVLGMGVPIPRQVSLGVLAENDFSSKQASEKNGWRFLTTDDADVIWSPGKLTQVVTKKDYTYTSWAGNTYKDMAVEIEAQPSSDLRIEWAGYGITFGISDGGAQNSYNFGVTTMGQYFLRKWVDGKVVTPILVPTTSSSFIQPRPTKNRLGVLIEGSRIALYINGNLVQTVTDESYKGGRVGVFTAHGTTDELAQVDFTRVRVLSIARARFEWGTRLASESPPPNGVWFDDDFSSETASRDKGWTWHVEDSDKAKFVWSPNKLNIIITSQNYAQVSSPGGRVLTDLGVEIEAEPASDVQTESIHYGIVFHLSGEQNRDFYRFGVNTSGQYYFVQVLGGKNIEPNLIEPTSSPLIKPRPAKNRLGVLVEGSKIFLYINGNLVNTVTDDSIKSGHVGIFASSGWANRAEVSFTRVTIYTTQRAKALWGTQLASVPTPASGILFQDDFNSQQASTDKGWVFTTAENHDRLWSSNKYTLVLKEKNLRQYSILLSDYQDMGIEIEAEADANLYSYGIVFRSDSGVDNNYRFGVQPWLEGQWGYYLMKEVNGKFPEPWLVDLRPSPLIKPGAKNRLGVLAEGTTISLYINGQRVKTVNDESFSSGRVGIFGATADKDRAQVTFSRVTIYSVAKAKAEWGAPPALTPGVLYQTNFGDKSALEEDGWELNPFASTDLNWSANKLTVIVKEKSVASLNGPVYDNYKDFGIEIEAQPEDTPNIMYGIVFRHKGRGTSKASYYMFGVSPGGEYFLRKQIEGQVIKPLLVEPTHSPLIKPGATKNRVGVLVEKSSIALYINGNLVKTLTDDSLTWGGVGTFAFSGSNEQAQVSFSRVTVYTAERAKSELSKR